MIDSVIWDAGGTLFDTYPSVVEAALKAASTFGMTADAELVLSLFRRSTNYAVRRLAEMWELDEAELRLRFETAYKALGPAAQAPFPYAVETCRQIIEVEGRNFIVTHRGEASLEGLLDAHHIKGYFTDWITGADPYPRKPDPASLLSLVARYHLDPACCLVVGDRDLDMLAGVRAGMKTCFYGNDVHTTPVDLEVTGFDQLLAWLRLERRQGRSNGSVKSPLITV